MTVKESAPKKNSGLWRANGQVDPGTLLKKVQITMTSDQVICTVAENAAESEVCSVLEACAAIYHECTAETSRVCIS